MKLKLVLFAFSMINLQCSKSDKGYHIYKIAYEGRGLKETSFIPEVIFEGSFDMDHIELSQNKKKLIDKRITTDNTIGVAFGYDLNIDSNDPVFFQFNNDRSLTLDSIRTYPYVYFSKDIESDTFRITYSVRSRKYK